MIKNKYIITDEQLNDIKEKVWILSGNSETSSQKYIFDIINDIKYHNINNLRDEFHKEIAKWKEEDPLFMAYDYGYKAGKEEASSHNKEHS